MQLQFAGLPVFDQERAKNFYVGHFGCRVVADVPVSGDGWRWIELAFAGSQTALHFLRREDDTPSDQPVLVLVDDQLEGTVERLRAGGVTILSGPQEAPYQPGRTVATFRDSEGNCLEIAAKSNP